jgi:thiol-disulfide isomerase/thioredoxin
MEYEVNNKNIKAIAKNLAIYLTVAIIVMTAIDFYRLKTQQSAQLPQSVLLQIQSHFSKPTKQPILLYAWGSWCPICSFTSPQVNALSEHFPVLSLAIRSGNNKEVKHYLQQKNYGFATLVDQHGSIAQQLNIKGTPAFFIIDQTGKVYYYSTGASTFFGLYLKLWLSQFFINDDY